MANLPHLPIIHLFVPRSGSCEPTQRQRRTAIDNLPTLSYRRHCHHQRQRANYSCWLHFKGSNVDLDDVILTRHAPYSNSTRLHGQRILPAAKISERCKICSKDECVTLVQEGPWTPRNGKYQINFYMHLSGSFVGTDETNVYAMAGILWSFASQHFGLSAPNIVILYHDTVLDREECDHISLCDLFGSDHKPRVSCIGSSEICWK